MRQKSSQVEQNCERRRRRKKCEMSNCYQIHFHGQLSPKGRNLSSSCINNAQRFSREEKFREKNSERKIPISDHESSLAAPAFGPSRNRLLIARPSDLLFLFISWNIRLIYVSRSSYTPYVLRALEQLSILKSSPHYSSRPHFVLQYRVLETNKRILKTSRQHFFPPLSPLAGKQCRVATARISSKTSR